MRPFSPFYFLRRNAARVSALVFVMSMSCLCYLIGLYAANPHDESLKNIEFYRDFAIVAPSDDEDSKEQFKDFTDAFESDGLSVFNVDYYAESTIVGHLMNVNYFSGVLFDTIMDFRGGVPFPVFHDPADLQRFADVLGIPYGGEDKAIIMGEKLATHFGLEIGNTIQNDHDRIFGLKDKLKLVGTFGKSEFGVPGQYTYFRADTAFKPAKGNSNAILILRKAGTGAEIEANRKQLADTVERIKILWDKLIFIDYTYQFDYVESTFTAFWPIFIAILAVIGIALTLTSAGIFSVVLEKRDYEFGIFSAVGFSKAKVLAKGIAEVLIVDLASVAFGGIVVIVAVTSVNEYFLSGRGQELLYYSDLALYSYALCNAAMALSLLLALVGGVARSKIVR